MRRIKELQDNISKLAAFKRKLDQECITGFAREVLLRTYITDLANRSNVDKLKIIV